MSCVIKLSGVAFMWICGLLVAPVLSMDNCSKYCFASCSDYWQTPEFSECVSANVSCDCHSRPSFNNPFVIFALIAVILMTTSCCCACYRKRARGSPPPTCAIVAQPVVAVPSTDFNYYNTSANFNHGNATTNYPSAQAPYAPVATPVSYPQAAIPAEYQPPPPYNECVGKANNYKV